MRGIVAKRIRKIMAKPPTDVVYNEYTNPSYGRVGDGVVKVESGFPCRMKAGCGRRTYKLAKKAYKTTMRKG